MPQISFFQLAHIHQFRATKHRRPCMYRELPFGNEQNGSTPHKDTQVLWNKLQIEAAKIKSFAWRFLSILTSKVGIMIDPSGKVGFCGVISVWKDCWIWKKQCKMVCVIIKRKSVTALELSESFNSYCWTQVHIHSQSLSLRECRL